MRAGISLETLAKIIMKNRYNVHKVIVKHNFLKKLHMSTIYYKTPFNDL